MHTHRLNFYFARAPRYESLCERHSAIAAAFSFDNPIAAAAVAGFGRRSSARLLIG